MEKRIKMRNAAILCYCLFVLGAFTTNAQETNSLGMQFARIPAGSFHMGSHGWEKIMMKHRFIR